MWAILIAKQPQNCYLTDTGPVHSQASARRGTCYAKRVRHAGTGTVRNVIDVADKRLVQWIGNLVQPQPVFLAAPAESSKMTGVGLYLMDWAMTPPARGERRPPLSVSLRYLVTVWLNEALEAHRLLGHLIFSLMASKEYEVEPLPLPAMAWQAFGIAPRPAILLRVPLRKPQPEKVAPRVKAQIAVEFGPMRPLEGRVMGPGGVAIMAATVLLPRLRLSTQTDHQGRFRFPAIPKNRPLTELRINARGQEISWPMPAAAGDGPLLINLEENQI